LLEQEPEVESFMRGKKDIQEMKHSLNKHNDIPRRRFDYVIANPPYVGYNECSKQKVLIFELMKQGKVRLNNIYGINLHSIPNHQKKYAPKPNLYAFFIALGIALLKNKGKLCYIIPQTILTAGDLDVLRYHLSKSTTIEKIITFSGKMFIGRGLKQNKPVATSSLIFVANRKKPSALHQVEIINYKEPNDTVEKALQNILANKTNKKIVKKKILQNKLLQNVVNWNFIKQSKKLLDCYKKYQRNTNDISVYYEHILAEQKFGNRFYFDGGGNILESKITNNKVNAYEIFDYKSNDYTRFTITTGSGKYYPKNEKITFPQGSQGIRVFQQQYKVIWRTKDTPKFQFCDKEILLISNQSLTISSNNKREILFLLSLLNSPLNRLILENNLLQEQEHAFLLPIKAIKQYVRVPKINENNQSVKEEIIKCTEELLRLEDKTLSDSVDFSKIMLQKFDNVSVEGNDLILEKDDEKIKLVIKENQGLVKKTQNEKYGKQIIELEQQQKITLSELKELSIIDFDKQQAMKDYIDDLVFALYFNIDLTDLGLNKVKAIKVKCSKNRYYKLVNNQKI